MPNLRDMVDGAGSLAINATVEQKSRFSVQQDVLIRRPVNRSGPQTNEVIVGRIMAMDGTNARVSVRKNDGGSILQVVSLKNLSPVTAAFRRSSVQFNTGFHGRV